MEKKIILCTGKSLDNLCDGCSFRQLPIGFDKRGYSFMVESMQCPQGYVSVEGGVHCGIYTRKERSGKVF